MLLTSDVALIEMQKKKSGTHGFRKRNACALRVPFRKCEQQTVSDLETHYHDTQLLIDPLT